MSTVTIGCPIRNRAWILKEYLEGITKQNYDRKLINLLFLVNDSKDSSLRILEKFKKENDSQYAGIDIQVKNLGAVEDERTPGTRDSIYHSLTEIRNSLLDMIPDTDYFFSVDSDILIPENALNILVNSKKDIVAGVIRNDYLVNPSAVYPWVRTNLMIKSEKDGRIVHYFGYPLNSLFEVEVTGAIYLLSKEVYKSVRYGYDVQGEDIYFCREAKKRGFKIWANSALHAEHVMIRYQDICNSCTKSCKEVLVKDNKVSKVKKYCPNRIERAENI